MIKGHAIASKLITELKNKVDWMYRESPSEKGDSGWRMFSGKEDDEYVENPDNFGIYEMETIAEIDDSILPYLDAPIGSEFEKDEKGNFILVDN